MIEAGRVIWAGIRAHLWRAWISYCSFGPSGNRKTIVASVLALWSIMTGSSGAAASFTTMFLARFGAGVGEAGCVPPSHSMIADSCPKERRSRALAFYSTGSSVDIIFALLNGGLLAHKFGWRSALFVAAIRGIVWAAIVFMVKVPIPACAAH